ncbi:MAG: aminotransferase class I/II-fold pyridoxal phosphate-dependent enzyme [Rhodothermales bacterium]
MTGNGTSQGGENFNLRDILLRGRKLDFKERTAFFSNWIGQRAACGDSLYLRSITSAADREVEVFDRYTGKTRRMLMFGSNNYLGLTNHPYVRERVKQTVDEFGVGVGGPPLLNGYTRLHRELEERLSAFKKKEDTLIFSSGYGTNVGMISCLIGKHDLVIHDAYSHASFHDGLKMGNATALKFPHNNVDELAKLLEATTTDANGDTFVGVEGIYSMDGDLAPLDRIAPLCRKHDAILLVDDAHGTGVMGPGGHGTAEHFGVEDQIDITMGTFSKAFGVVGGFVSTSKAIADYMRFFARSYFFSASMPPVVVAAVLACLDVLEQEPEIQQRLHDNVAYAAQGLRCMGFDVHPQSAIITLILPETVNLRKAAYHLHKAGIFLNSIEYPAVPAEKQRFRISLMATHTREDIDYLLECIEEAWDLYAVPYGLDVRAAAPL